MCSETFKIGFFGIKKEKVKAMLSKPKDKVCMPSEILSKNLIEFLISIGLKYGDKVVNKVGIPNWIKSDLTFLKACIRGLIDTDGSIYELKPHWPGLWQICFTNKSEQLLSDFSEGLISVGINPSKTYRYKDGKKTPKIYVTKKSELSKFYKEIGFSNPKHQNKL